MTQCPGFMSFSDMQSEGVIESQVVGPLPSENVNLSGCSAHGSARRPRRRAAWFPSRSMSSTREIDPFDDQSELGGLDRARASMAGVLTYCIEMTRAKDVSGTHGLYLGSLRVTLRWR